VEAGLVAEAEVGPVEAGLVAEAEAEAGADADGES
jgi:hypothetical protein